MLDREGFNLAAVVVMDDHNANQLPHHPLVSIEPVSRMSSRVQLNHLLEVVHHAHKVTRSQTISVVEGLLQQQQQQQNNHVDEYKMHRNRRQLFVRLGVDLMLLDQIRRLHN